MLSETVLDSILAGLGSGTAARELESEWLDFKEPAADVKSTLNELAATAVCFANSARGGTIVLGVRDKPVDRGEALVGASLVYSVEMVRKGVFDRTKPPLTPFAREHEVDGVRLVVIEVPPGVAVHSTADGRATRRLGTECLPFTPDQQRELLMARGHIDWSAEPSGLDPKRLSAAQFERLRRLLRAAGKDDLSALRDRLLLDALHLIAPDGTATNAAVLVLGEEEMLREAVPTYEYSYQYRETPGAEASVRFRRNRPILEATEDLLRAVSAQSKLHPLNTAGGVQLQLVDYPESAVRELVVNGLMHRAYDAPGSVDIEQSQERLTVISPGGLVAGVTPENILSHPSTPRHRLLSEVIAACQLAEKTGQGIDRAYREMLRVGKQPPMFEDSGLAVRALLPGGIGNDVFVRFVTALPDALSGDVEVLLALDFLRSSKTIDAQKLGNVIQRPPNEAQTVLARLADDRFGILEPTRGSARRPFALYRLRSRPLAALDRALAYHRRTPDDVDPKVVAHVQEYGYITNRTLQTIFDIHVFAARDLLADLRTRGVVQKIGTAQGGTGVRYGKGPRFAAAATRIRGRAG